MTLPRLVIHWFVGCMMPECTIAVVPNGRYDRGKGGSLKECVWSAHMNREHEITEGDEFIPIMSRYCSGRTQHRVGDYYLDGYKELKNGGRE